MTWCSGWKSAISLGRTSTPQVALVHMGLAFGEIFDLDALAADCAADGRYSFLLAGPSLPITGAVGSPVAAVALK